jgi:hypothetical protein
LAIRYWIGDWENFEKEIDNPIAKGAPFRIVIDILLSGYSIGIGKTPTIQLETNVGKRLPPWSAENIFVSKKIHPSI